MLTFQEVKVERLGLVMNGDDPSGESGHEGLYSNTVAERASQCCSYPTTSNLGKYSALKPALEPA